jgi:hypothetical protein
MRRVLAVAAGLAAVALVATKAEATPIGTFTTTDKLTFTLSDNGPFGDIFTTDGTADTRQFTLSLNTANYTGANTDTFNSLALKLSSQLDAAKQTSAPSTGGNPFVYKAGGLNNGGCDGSGSGFFCTDSSTGVLLNGSTYMWTFLVDPGAGFFTDPTDMTIKAQWFTAEGKKIQQLSDEFGPAVVINPTGGGDATPEPTTLLLLSSGLAGVVGAKYRRRRAS